MLRVALDSEFDNSFKNNGNSFDSCFQFVAKMPIGDLNIRIKYYWKGLALLQSESVAKSLGMNTNNIFCPTLHMGRKLKETKDEGLSRIEITYTAVSYEAERKLLNLWFPERAKRDLDAAFRALNSVDGLGRHLTMKELLDGFVEGAKGHQLLIVEKSIAAMVYASNSKTNCFTGFWQKKALNS